MSTAMLSGVLRKYHPDDGYHVETARVMVDDLTGDWGTLAVAERALETDELVDWHAYHDESRRVATYWPESPAGPIWSATNAYRFYNPLRAGRSYFTLHEWPDELDADVEVLLP